MTVSKLLEYHIDETYRQDSFPQSGLKQVKILVPGGGMAANSQNGHISRPEIPAP